MTTFITRRHLLFPLVMMMVLLSGVCTAFAAQPVLSRTSTTIAVGSSRTLRVTNAESTSVSWKSEDPKRSV